ncbi:hypothetical protein ACO0LF_29890 [Undibacterium sp. Di27W]|uniref:hypothetical protein n=1 Tax=Undibacterium sp. Di27W TaxID=3413036 RepID=UPI003BF0546F
MYRFLPFLKRILSASLLLSVVIANAADLPKLAVKLQLNHIAEGKWRADYFFDEAINKLSFEIVGDYRAKAWKAITPGVRYQQGAKVEEFVADQPVKTISLEISTYSSFAPKNYAPNNRFSDGGAAV